MPSARAAANGAAARLQQPLLGGGSKGDGGDDYDSEEDSVADMEAGALVRGTLWLARGL